MPSDMNVGELSILTIIFVTNQANIVTSLSQSVAASPVVITYYTESSV